MAGTAEEYVFAVEYSGPPVPYEIPRAIPIEIDRIPVAAMAAPSALPTAHHLLHLPVIHPFPSPKKPALASPTSVIENRDGLDGETSGEIPERAPVTHAGAVDAPAGALVSYSSELKESDESDGSSSGHLPGSEFAYSGFEDEMAASPTARVAAVTFQDPGERSGSASRLGSCHRETEAKIKKGSCCRCLRGNLFTEKEACLVCDAKYCGSCVLRAMGSMPEGRKCVSCIGFSIEESKREKLGRCSRLMRRLLSILEVQQVMQAEKFCDANQLRPEHVCVNGKQLSQDEMIILQGCAIPPSKLRPGHYWYDKVSGLWGKEGHKPHLIISPNLNVGGSLIRNASHGNTGILVNGREITKVELQMLKWAGVMCAGNPHFWLNADGTYQEEGQKNIKGQIWGKPGVRLICSLLSLPHPCKAEHFAEKEVNKMFDRPLTDHHDHRIQKLLLVGHQGSGTSTIFKQAKFLYRGIPFSDEEQEEIKIIIQSNTYSYLAILLEGRERFEEECLIERRKEYLICSSSAGESASLTEYSIGRHLKAFSDWILKVMASGSLETIFLAATREYAPVVEKLWKEPAIQATFMRRHELDLLPDVASYFLERVVEISKPDYEPTKMDILCADGITSCNGLACTDFFFPPTLSVDTSGADADDQQKTCMRHHQLIQLQARGSFEHCKWLDMFEDVQLVIFCVSMSDYDEYYEDSTGALVNKMVASRHFFENIAANPTFDQMDFLLILTKFDILERKIDTAPLTLCDWLSDFRPVTSRNNGRSGPANGSTMAHLAFHHIAVKFKRLFARITGKKLYVTPANALDSGSVDVALRYGREILKWQEERIQFGPSECSMYSNDPSSFSP